MKNFKRYMLLLVSILGIATLANAQTKKEKARIKAVEVNRMLDSLNFVFNVQNVNPSRGGSFWQLNMSGYNVEVSKNEIKSYLPYFGRAFTAPVNPAEGGIRFTTSDFTYEIDKRKKGKRTLVIEPENVNQVLQMTFTVSDSGYASLHVSSNNRDPITFSGYITEKTN